MQIEHLKELLVLAECGNLHEAADRLFTTQSTLSKHIGILETELGVVLFDRTTRQVCLSAYGRIFLPYASQIVQAHQEGTSALLAQANKSKSTLTIGTMPKMFSYRISDILIKFQKENPLCTLHFFGNDPDKLKQCLLARECDLAFIRHADKLDLGDLVEIPYATDHLVAVIPTSHPLAEKQSISLAELRDERFLMSPSGSFMHQYVTDACRAYGFEPNITITIHRSENLIDLAAQGAGVCLLMKQPIENTLPPNAVMLDIVPAHTCKISLFYKKGEKLSITAQNFLRYVQQAREAAASAAGAAAD